MGFFNKAKARSFEEITAVHKESSGEVMEDGEAVDNVNESVESAGKFTKTAVPFDKGEFNALSCFGWKADRTENWLQKCAKGWFLAMSFLWFVFGAMTFAPIIFISNKVDVLFKDRKKSLLCGIIVYAVMVALMVLLFAPKGRTDASISVNAETITEAITSDTTGIANVR